MIPTSKSNPFSLYSSDGLIWFTEAPGGLLTIGSFDQSAAPSATTDIKSGAGGVKPSSEEAKFEKTEAKRSSDEVEPTSDETSGSAGGGFIEWSLKRDGSNLAGIHEGSVWFIDKGRNTIGRLDLAPDPGPAPGPAASPVGGYLSPMNTLVILAPWLAVIGLVGCISIIVVVAKKR
jgi:streptogramin lyase